MAKNSDRRSLTARGREMAALVSKQKRSGLSIREFARLHGVPAGTLAWWGYELRGHQKRRPKPSAGTLLPVTVVEDLSSGGGRSPVGLVVALAGGCRVEVPAGFDAGDLKRLMEVLASC